MKNKSISILILLLFAFSYLNAENWPNWRGPRRDSTSSESGLPQKWSKTENVIWRTPLPGPAASTPIIWSNRIFLTSAEGDNLVLICISTDGKILWKQVVGTGNKNAKGDEANLAAPSPSTDGKYVFAFFGSGDLAAYDFAGKQIWKTNLQKAYGDFDLNFVMSSTPLLDGDRLYLQLIHSGAQLVMALDKSTGKEIWKNERRTDARDECLHSYASPYLYREGKREFLLIHGADYITAHQLKDGTELWRAGSFNPKERYNPNFRFVASPVGTAGLIVVPTAKNGPVIGLNPDAQSDMTNSMQKRVWTLERGTPDVPSPLINQGIVYLNRENGVLIAIDAKTGNQIYQERAYEHRHRASPIYGDGKIYLTARDGTVTVVKAGRSYEVLSKNEIGEQISASPAISNGRIYLRTFDALYAIGK
ncbi:PQQ-binding-like beta-propeller repeat protein [bacterium]|nr:PQQ-binding-like beta-propeller repeat protein [bacterium]